MKTYKIYRLENYDIGDVLYKYYTPEVGVDYQTKVQRATHRMLDIADLKRRGYVVTGIMLTDKEEYLNHRLNEYVAEYVEKDREETKVRLNRYCYTPEVAYTTLELLQDRKRTLVQHISRTVRRLQNEGLLVQNEMAIMIYDMHIRSLF